MNDLSLDAREVLTHLNNLGYRNISAQQLKEFMKDLKKLIKYEDRFGPYQQSNRNRTNSGKTCYMSPEIQLSPRIRSDKRIYNSKTSSPKFSPTSFILPLSNRSTNSPKLNKQRKSASTSITPRDYTKNVTCRNASTSPIRPISDRKPISLKNSSPKSRLSRMSSPKPMQNYSECYQRRSRSALGRESLQRTQIFQRSKSACSACMTDTLKLAKVPRECNMERQRTRKSSQVVPQNKPLKADPVQLYQYYKSEWERFKPNTPGESPRTALRWKIRQKILKGRQ